LAQHKTNSLHVLCERVSLYFCWYLP